MIDCNGIASGLFKFLMIIIYILFGVNRLPRQKSWTLAGGTLQHLAASLYIKLYDYGNIVLCCEIL